MPDRGKTYKRFALRYLNAGGKPDVCHFTSNLGGTLWFYLVKPLLEMLPKSLQTSPKFEQQAVPIRYIFCLFF